MTETTVIYFETLKSMGYQPYPEHQNCTLNRASVVGLYCTNHEVKVLPADSVRNQRNR